MARLRDFTRAMADRRYQPQIPALVVPAIVDCPQVGSVAAYSANFQLRMVRAIIPRTGTLRDVTWWVGTASGNYIAAVYDTGDAVSGVRTKLAASASTAVAGTSAWQSWDPALAVTAGQQVELGLMLDNTTATIGRAPSLVTGNAAQLPSGFNVVPGAATPRFSHFTTAGSLVVPDTIADGSFTNTSPPVFLMARVA